MVRAGLTRERVRAAALAVADAEGIGAVTMRRVGQELGVEAMSLYRHVRDKADLLDAVHEAVLTTMNVAPPRGPWADDVRALARAFRRAMLAHPRCAELFATRPAVAPGALAAVESALGVLRGAGFSPRAAVHAFQCLLAFVVGQVLQQVGPQLASEGGEGGAAAVDYAALPASEFPQLRASAALLADYDHDAEFEYGLRAMLAGLEAALTPRRR